jgi:hypothetical protein
VRESAPGFISQWLYQGERAMKNHHQTYCRIGAGIALFCSTLALGAPQVPPSAPVTVVNTPANPVPVTGSLGVSGTVSISGTVPVTQSGTWNVGVAGTLNTKNIDERGRNPFSVTVQCSDGSGNSCVASTPPVPAGQRLVLEYVGGGIQVNTTAGTVGVQGFVLFIDGTSTELALPPRFIGSASGTENYGVSERVLMFAEAGQVLKVQFSGWNAHIGGFALLSGYLIDLSQ